MQLYLELFTIDMPTVSNIICDTRRAINIGLCHEIGWPIGARFVEVQNDFKLLCRLPVVVGAIDSTYISTSKPRIGSKD